MKQIITITTTVAGVAATLVSLAPSGDPVAAQVATVAKGMLVYASDYNDMMPLAFAKASEGEQWHWSKVYRSPDIHNLDAHVWANTVRPYWQAERPLALDGPTHIYNLSIQEGHSIGITYNGLLHGFPTSSIENPKLVPITWTPYGKQNYYGALANPSLHCILFHKPCRFGNEMASGAMFMGSKPIVDFSGRLYVANGDLSISKPKASVPDVKQWKEGIWVEVPGARAYASAPSGKTGGNAPKFFAPDRKE